jgi:hypothetical protein
MFSKYLFKIVLLILPIPPPASKAVLLDGNLSINYYKTESLYLASIS